MKDTLRTAPLRLALGVALSILVLTAPSCRSTTGDSELMGDQLAATSDKAAKGRSVQDYADECKRELGIASVALPDMNCLNGVEVPITIDGAAPTDYTFPKLKDGKLGCDKAEWYEGTCHLYTFVQRLQVAPQIDGVLSCRQKYWTSRLNKAERIARYRELASHGGSAADQLAAFKDIYEFDDLGLLLRNRTTGKSCFFGWLDQGHGQTRVYGGWIPAPDKRTVPDRAKILAALPDPKPPAGYDETMWNRPPQGTKLEASNGFLNPADTAAAGCLRCHSDGLFKHSPFIDQAKSGGENIVPPNSKSLPYLVVGAELQATFPTIQQITTAKIDGADNRCTSCHHLNNFDPNTVGSQIFNWSVGRTPPHPSETAAEWPAKAWMPLGHTSTSQAPYDDNFKKVIDAVKCCMAHPTSVGCKSRKIGPTTEGVGLAADGTLSGAWTDGGQTPSCLPN